MGQASIRKRNDSDYGVVPKQTKTAFIEAEIETARDSLKAEFAPLSLDKKELKEKLFNTLVSTFVEPLQDNDPTKKTMRQAVHRKVYAQNESDYEDWLQPATKLDLHYSPGGGLCKNAEEQGWLETIYWDVLVNPLINAMNSSIRPQYESIHEAEKSKLISKEEAAARCKKVDRSIHNAAISRAKGWPDFIRSFSTTSRNAQNTKEVMEEYGFTSQDIWQAKQLTKLEYQCRAQIEKMFESTLKQQREGMRKRELAYDEGWPSRSQSPLEKMHLTQRFKDNISRNHIQLPLPPEGIETDYLRISPPYNPINHHGVRPGINGCGQRSDSEIRDITFYFSSFEQTFQLHIPHPSELTGVWTGYDVILEFEKRRLVPKLIMSIKRPRLPIVEKSTLCGASDPGWYRILDRTEAAQVLYTEDRQRGGIAWILSWEPIPPGESALIKEPGRIIIRSGVNNKWLRFWTKKNPDYPLAPTPSSLENFVGLVDETRNRFKAKVLLALNGRAPVGWDKCQKKGLLRLFERVPDCPEHPLFNLVSDFRAWLALDKKLWETYKVAWGIFSDNLKQMHRLLAQELLLRIPMTDFGLMTDEFKKTAEKDKSFGGHFRQLTAPGALRQEIAWTAQKYNVRIHWIRHEGTTYTHYECGFENEYIEGARRYKCEGCGDWFERDPNSAHIALILTEYCVFLDAKSDACLRKKKSAIGIQDLHEAKIHTLSNVNRDVSCACIV